MLPRLGADPLRREHARAMARWLVGAAVDFVEALVGARAVAEDLGAADVVGGGCRCVAGEKDGAACLDEVGVDLEAKFGGEGEERGRGGGRLGCMGSTRSCCGGHCDWGWLLGVWDDLFQR